MAIVMVRRWYVKQVVGEASFLARLKNYQGLGNRQLLFVACLVVLAYLCWGLAYWGPSWGVKLERSEAVGSDVLFVLDVSKSMMAQDLSSAGGASDRLSAAKEMVSEYVASNPENRYGLVIFAGEAFVSTPLTLDHSAFETFLSSVSYEDIGEQGTDLAGAVALALGRFEKEDQDRGKVMVVVSDGGEEAEDNLDEVISKASDLGVKIVTVGIGNDTGVPIPEGKDMFGRSVYKTYQGEQVLTKLNDAPLKELAQASGGEYIHAQNRRDMQRINSVLDQVQKNSMLRAETSELENRYQLFLWPVLVVLGMVAGMPLMLRLRRSR